MKTRQSLRIVAVLGTASLFSLGLLQAGVAPAPKNDKQDEEEILQLSPFVVEAGPATGFYAHSTLAGTRLGATVGGAKNSTYFRDVVKRGGFPHPDTITAEGLFSEHDLPLRSRQQGSGLLVLNAEAVPAAIYTKPEVRYLAQIGLSSGLDAATWKREPVNLIAVVDKSGSMSGQPLDLVKRSLHQLLSQLTPDDQLGIVLYGDQSQVHLSPTATTPANREQIAAAINAIASAGSTNMEAGLRVGFALARESAATFAGRTRVMQFTDERPNVGRTDADSFMGMMKAASHDGIGQTTIGVGIQFDAELASTISAVRGGNLFYFPDAPEMTKTFKEEFDTFITELAHDFELTIKAADGLQVAAVYGVPGEALHWSEDGAVRMHVSTLFLSKRKGAIYVTLAPANPHLPAARLRAGEAVAQVKLSYREIDEDEPTEADLAVPCVNPEEASPGLRRGRLLISEFLGLREAMTEHLTRNNQPKSHRLLAGLETMLRTDPDRTLRRERKLVGTLTRSMALLAGRGAESYVEGGSSDPKEGKVLANQMWGEPSPDRDR